MNAAAPSPTSIDFLLSIVGCGLSPASERHRAILRAIEERRLDDAARRLDASHPGAAATQSPSESIEVVWDLFLRGYRALAAGETKQAVPALAQAAAAAGAIALTHPRNSTTDEAAAAAELAGIANLVAGRALRRQERAAEAELAHRCAEQLARHLDVRDLLWAARLELAQDAGLAAVGEAVEARFAEALDAAEDPIRSAHTLAFLARHRASAADPAGASAAAREALAAWQNADAGCAERFRAARLVGESQLALAELSLSSSGAETSKLIHEASAHLRSAREGLEPFGPEAESDLREIDELLAVAERVGAVAGA